MRQSDDFRAAYVSEVKCVLKRVSFGSKDCIKELKLECAFFLFFLALLTKKASYNHCPIQETIKRMHNNVFVLSVD